MDIFSSYQAIDDFHFNVYPMTDDAESEEQMRLSGVDRTYQEKDKAPIAAFIQNSY